MLRRIYKKLFNLLPQQDPAKKWGIETFHASKGFDRFGGRENGTIMVMEHDASGITPFDAHYIYHPAWAGRILKETNPEKHIDISSTLHFCSLLSAFMPVEFYDFRPAPLNLTNLISGSADLTALHFPTSSVQSLSCMHTVEHVGLGRYGDPIDPDGDLKAIGELKRVLAPGGNLLFVVPVGKPTVVFNAHRIYSYEMIMEYFEGLTVKDFSLIDDRNQFYSPAAPQNVALQQYGCGCFWFQKPLS